MSLGGEPLDAYVASDRVGLWRSGRPLGWFSGDGEAARLDRAIDAAGLARRRWPFFRTALRVWLSGSLAHPFLMPAVAGLKSLSEAKAAAAARISQELGWSGDIAIWLDAVPARIATLGVAVQRATIQALQDAAERGGARLTSIRPWWTLALQAEHDSIEEVDAMAIEDTDSLVLLACDGEHWREVACYEPRPTGAQSESAVRRRTLTLPSGKARIRRARIQPADETEAAGLAPTFVQSLGDE